MVKTQTILKYKTIKGPLHKVPPIIKLILLLPISVFCLSLPSFWLGITIFLMISFAFICRITLLEQVTDLLPALFYGFIMYIISILSNFNIPFFNSQISFPAFFIPSPEYIQVTLRLILLVQISALIFRTTSFLEIREVVKLEVISLFLCFIPEVFKIWSSINMSWKMRHGKPGIIKLKTLLFVLISLSFEKAVIKARALNSRRSL